MLQRPFSGKSMRSYAAPCWTTRWFKGKHPVVTPPSMELGTLRIAVWLANNYLVTESHLTMTTGSRTFVTATDVSLLATPSATAPFSHKPPSHAEAGRSAKVEVACLSIPALSRRVSLLHRSFHVTSISVCSTGTARKAIGAGSVCERLGRLPVT